MIDRARTVALAALAFASAAMWSLPAAATGTIFCTGAEAEDVSVQIGVGRLPILAVINARIEAGGTVYAMTFTDEPDATEIMSGQGVLDEDYLRVDFTDPNIERIVVSLRVLRAFDGKSGAEAGLLHVIGEGVWSVVCESG